MLFRSQREGFDHYLQESVPVGRWATPEDIAPAVLFLASAAARFVNGQTLAIDGGHDLHIDLAHPECVLLVDPEKTNRALTNVLSNAVKYSPQGGSILVTTQMGDVRGLPAVGLRITDRGIGMSPDQLARVFERFYRADPSGNIPGTGLGMSLVKEIVELQGGRVEIASALGRGTTVTLWLPLAPVPTQIAMQ